MTMYFCINAEQLRKALADIERAEQNGFNYCEAIFNISSAGRCLDDCKAEYSDLSERAHPTDPSLNWGRFQNVTRDNKFVDGKLVSTIMDDDKLADKALERMSDGTPKEDFISLDEMVDKFSTD